MGREIQNKPLIYYSSFVLVPDPEKKDSIAKNSKNQISFILSKKMLNLNDSTSCWHQPFIYFARLIDFMRHYIAENLRGATERHRTRGPTRWSGKYVSLLVSGFVN